MRSDNSNPLQGTAIPQDQRLPDTPAQAPAPQPEPTSPPSAVGFVGPGPQASSATEEQPPLVIGSWQSFYENAMNAVTSRNVWHALRTKREFVNQGDTSVPVLNADQISNLKDGRPGIVFPDAVRQTTAAGIVANYDSDRNRRDILNTIQPTTSGKIAGAGGSFIGSILGSPIETAAEVSLTDGIGLAEKLGLGRVAFKESLVASTLAKGAGSAIDGGVFGAIQSAADDVKSIQNGESIDFVQNISNTASLMALGGVLGSLGEYIPGKFKQQKELLKNRSFFGNNGSDDTATSSANRMSQGQDPDIGVALKNGVAAQVDQFHKDIKANDVTPESMHDALDEADKNISEQSDQLSAKMDDFEKRTKDRALTPDEQKEVKGLGGELQKLKVAAQSSEAQRYMLNNEGMQVTPEELKSYGNKINNAHFDYAAGRGQEDVPPQGAPVKNQKTNLEDQYPQEVQDQLLDGAKLTKEQKQELDHINESEERNTTFKKALSTTIKCILGN